jgi:DNA-binding transcriptional regulator GbsR (MarR family)
MGAISDNARKQILRLCKKRPMTPSELAEALGKSVNTVRAYYVYPMAREGLLVPTHEQGKRKPVYRAAT